MATAKVNGVELYYELNGEEGEPLVLVHGAWWSHRGWESVVPRFARSFQVLTYDRRGHSSSERPTGQGSVHDDVVDLAELIEQLDLAPAWVGGVSSGAAIVLRLAAERPELVRGVVLHEPALFPLLADDPETAPMVEAVNGRIGAVAERIRSGDHSGAAQQFVETVAADPGRWAELSPEHRRILTENAPAFLDDVSDPEALAFDLTWLRDYAKPALLTHGEESPPAFGRIISRLAGAMPHARVQSFSGAGHVPHRTHPDAYVTAVSDFVRGSATPHTGSR